jgi:hypothetical protein
MYLARDQVSQQAVSADHIASQESRKHIFATDAAAIQLRVYQRPLAFDFPERCFDNAQI